MATSRAFWPATLVAVGGLLLGEGVAAADVAAQLRNFRSGKRPHEVMVVISKPLSDDDIADLAVFYSSL
jgi:cytochrome c553